jgi:hypothetical protein
LVGKESFLQFVLLASINGDESARAWLRSYEVASALGKLAPDRICILSGVRPDDLLAAVVKAGVTLGARTSQMVYAALKPKIVKKMAQSALRISGKHAEIAQKDRLAILQHDGFLPTPARMVINNNNTANAESKAAAAAAANSEPSVPSFLDDIDSTQAARESVQRTLLAVPAREGTLVTE